MASTLSISNTMTSFVLFPSEPTRLRRSRSLAFASFTERERRYLTPMNLFAMRKKKQEAQAPVVHE